MTIENFLGHVAVNFRLADAHIGELRIADRAFAALRSFFDVDIVRFAGNRVGMFDQIAEIAVVLQRNHLTAKVLRNNKQQDGDDHQ